MTGFVRTGAARIGLVALFLILAGPGAGAQEPGRAASVRPLTPFQRQKAERLLRDRLPCLGCHRLDGEGGRVGPDLSRLKGREASYVYAMIRDPEATAPGTRMPRVPTSAGTLDLIARYLLNHEPPAEAPPPESPVVERMPPPKGPEDAPAAYARYCAPCHGTAGAGDGPNAPFLPVPPAGHSDAAYMSGRSDDALFDAIYAGGYVMDRSARMPAFGRTLTTEQIRDLVRYLRQLCGCEGPGWAREEP